METENIQAFMETENLQISIETENLIHSRVTPQLPKQIRTLYLPLNKQRSKILNMRRIVDQTVLCIRR